MEKGRREGKSGHGKTRPRVICAGPIGRKFSGMEDIMVRLIGGLAVILGSSGFALRVVGERRAYLARCRRWRELFALMENEVAFRKSSMPEICCRAGARLTGEKRLFLERVGQGLSSGEGGTLREVWRREAERAFLTEPLKKEAEREVLELGGRLCFEDGEMQRKMLSEAEAFLKSHEEEQERLDRERNRLTLCAGVMGGLLLTVLLL